MRPEKVQELRNRIGGKAARDELFRYVSQDFEETANAAYAAIGKPLITLENVWVMFTMLANYLSDYVVD